jgi:antitoxin HicB
MSRKINRHGSTFEKFLQEEGLHAAATAHAIKVVFAWQIHQSMKSRKLTKAAMAKRMNTSRAHLDRLLDPQNDRVQLDTMQRAAAAVGKKLHLELV